MKVEELIEQLKRMPQYANVGHIWDGAYRTDIEFVWLSKGGTVLTADFAQYVYNDSDRPLDAPSVKDEEYWSTPEKIKGKNQK